MGVAGIVVNYKRCSIPGFRLQPRTIRRSDDPKKIAAPTPWSRSPMAHHQS
jgi:hypothetical protein